MQTALVLMTILGCDDSATECHYIATLPERWPNIELCDSVSDTRLATYSNAPYPVVVAVCQNPEDDTVNQANTGDSQTAPNNTALPSQDSFPVAPKMEESLAAKAIGRVRNILPSTEGVKTLLTKPVRIVEDGYSWVARRFTAE